MNSDIHPAKLVAPFLGMLLVGGCTWGIGGGEEVPEMHRNLARTVDIQTGVVQGDLEKAQKAAVWLVGREDQMAFSGEGKEYQSAMLHIARRISETEDLSEVALQTGQLAGSCGACHQALGGGPRFAVGTSAPDGDSQEALMVRHLWAADRMWEGLVGPSDEAWEAGARAISETQPALARAHRASTSAEGTGDLLQEVNLLSKEAMEATGLESRANVYGRLLTTCNQCHGPNPSLAGA